MMTTTKLLLAGAAIAAACLAWTTLRPRAAHASVEAMPPPMQAPAAHRVANANPAPERRHEHEEPTPEQLRAVRTQAQDAREAKFRAEPVTAAWSARMENDIRNALSPAALKRAGVDTPLANLQADCRTFTCRVEVTYADQDEFELAQQQLLLGVGAELTSVSGFIEEQPDGSLRNTIYASGGANQRTTQH